MNDDPEIVDRVLALLRQWGWETGYKKLQVELRADNQNDELARQFFLGWMAAERGSHEEAVRHFRAIAQVPPLAGWALVGQAFVATRQKGDGLQLAQQLLDEASLSIEPGETMLQATIDHLRGTILFNQSRPEEAQKLLLRALTVFSIEDFRNGRVLDTLGMIYGGKDNFHAAEEFFKTAIRCKETYGDLAGLAVSHGQLGRLYLSWGHLDKAEQHFQNDLRLSQHIDDERGQAQMYNSLGQVAQARAERLATAGRDVQRHWETAGQWNDSCIRRSQGKWPDIEAYARKDWALAFVATGRLDDAEDQVKEAERLFRQIRFDEGIAHVMRTRGIIQRFRANWNESLACLRGALRHFVDNSEALEATRTQFEIARTRRAADDPRPLVSQAFLDALGMAESCRRARLIGEIEEELQVVDREAYCAHIYRRVRGHAVTEGTTSLIDGRRETVSVLYLDLKGSTEYARSRDPEEVMMTLNQMMTDLVGALRRHDARVTAFRGDGFLALLREADHAVRAVSAALSLFDAIKVFNEPREVLGLPLFTARIGISSGEVFLGNVGTYDKLDYTAIGTTANLGARLEGIAYPGLPCISAATHELVSERFAFKKGNPRKRMLKGLGKQLVWDVVASI